MQPKDSSNDKQPAKGILHRFEQTWQYGNPPAIQDFLGDATMDRRALLQGLVRIDLKYRLKAGQLIGVEDYLQSFPELAGNAAGVIELIEAQYNHCRTLGRNPSVQDYLQRFPGYRDELVKRFPSFAIGAAPTAGLETTVP